MLEKFNAAIFDLDGTLVDSMGMWTQIDIDYLARWGYELPDDLQKAIEGFSFSETAMYFKTRFNIPDELEKIKSDWNSMAHEHYNSRIGLKENVRELLKELETSGVKMAIATSNSRYLAELVLEANEIKGHFEHIVTSCDVDKGKPFPDVYLKAASMLGVDPDECIAFEDTVAGAKAARGAGMYTVGIFDVHSEKYIDELRENTDMFIHGYSEIFQGVRK